MKVLPGSNTFELNQNDFHPTEFFVLTILVSLLSGTCKKMIMKSFVCSEDDRVAFCLSLFFSKVTNIKLRLTVAFSIYSEEDVCSIYHIAEISIWVSYAFLAFLLSFY